MRRAVAHPLEEISVPTLIINARDDGLSAIENAVRASERVPRSKLFVVDRGGHLLLGSESLIRKEISEFVASAASAASAGVAGAR
jgi:pimeloyl-ACP methyl ester carboxylesterase